MKDFYTNRIAQLTLQFEKENKSANELSILRGISFLAAFLLLMGFISTLNSPKWYLLIIALVIGLVFYRIVLLHIKRLSKASKLESLININKLELARISFDLTKIENGEHYTNPDHPYHIDLDIFGQHSLYQLINRCQIPESKSLLAKWLSKRASIEEIKSRQGAIQELSKDLEWYQDFQSTANMAINKRGKRAPIVSQEELINWANREYSISNEKLWKPLTILTTAISVAMILTVIFTTLPAELLYLLLIPNGFLLYRSIKHLRPLAEGIDKANYLVSTFLKTLPLIEKSEFKSEKLRSIQQRLGRELGASMAMKKLSYLTYRLSVRGNILYPIINVFFLTDAYMMIDLYKWKKRHRMLIHGWLEVVNEMECLISLAGYYHTNPTYCFPKVTNDSFHFEAHDLGHPLIAPEEMVLNDYQIKGKGKIDILTGSNMSGKSTFERTVGINMVLAQVGAPVYAKSLKMGQTNVFTSMRTVDDISKHASSFYAELSRIKQLLEHGKEHASTFVVIDEVLKGTNSDDRHIGAMALVNKLSELNVFGIISTHDLALGKETKDLKWVRNYSFNSEIVGDKIHFDYKLTPGLCKSFNASKLMEKMGIIS